MTGPRRVVRRSLLLLLAVRLILLLYGASGAVIPAFVLRAMEAAILAPFAASAAFFGDDYRRHRRAPLPRRAAATAAMHDTVPLAFRRLVVHEVKLFTSFLRWICLRGPQGVRKGDLVVRYASGQLFLFAGFLFASLAETFALAVVIPWPVVRESCLVIDVWGVYFVVALHASCVVRPHVVRADGSLLLRYGVLIEVAVPAAQIARAREERRFDSGGPAKLRPDGTLEMGMGGQTMVAVELNEPVGFLRPLGKSAEARMVRFYADRASVHVNVIEACEQRR